MTDTTASNLAFVRKDMLPESQPPVNNHGPFSWMRANLFSSIPNTLLTLFGIYIIYLIIPPIANFAIIHAVWEGEDRSACLGQEGACWAFVKAYFTQFIYGRYPVPERWRVDVVFFIGAVSLALLLMFSFRRQEGVRAKNTATAAEIEQDKKRAYRTGMIQSFNKYNGLFLLVVYPVMSLILLTGGEFEFSLTTLMTIAILFAVVILFMFIPFFARAESFSHCLSNVKPLLIAALALAIILYVLAFDFGLRWVETSVWGGLLVTLVIAVTGIAASFPLGILFALGRRSKLPFIRLISIAFIEFWRGVPLITVLFMSSVMLPLFLPEGMTFDKLLRALVGVALFAAAYMAETIRGGLQAIPRGQYEGAMALGLSYWQMMRMIILPQALKLVIPGIVNIFIALFKDTTLVLIIGLFDFLGQIQSSFTDPRWATPTQNHTGYFFAAIVYFLFCFGMSRYSLYVERSLNTTHKR